jgi:hypothetical protein
VLIVGQDGFWTYDVASRSTTKWLDFGAIYLKDETGATVSNTLRYNNKLVMANGTPYYVCANGDVWKMNLDRRNFGNSTLVKLVTSGTPPPGLQAYAFDRADGLIVGGPVADAFYAFNPATKAWTSKSVPGTGTVAFQALDYDEVDNVLFFITDQSSGRNTWAYRYGG